MSSSPDSPSRSNVAGDDVAGDAEPSGSRPRFVVESGIDGSWLVVDLGADRHARIAIARHEVADDARSEADLMSGMDALFPGDFSDFAELHEDLPAVLAEHEAAIDAAHNYNYLLPTPPAGR
jgi:hypothetical protein